MDKSDGGWRDADPLPDRRLPADCAPFPDFATRAEAPKESPVQVTAQLAEDPGVAAPVDAWVPDWPVTVVLRFDHPVDPATFHLALTDADCPAAIAAVDQEVRWLSAVAAEVTIRAAVDHGYPLTLSFGGGRDRAGKRVAEPVFYISRTPFVRGVALYQMDVAGGRPREIAGRREDVRPVSLSPDARFLLLARLPFKTRDSPSPERIPYVWDVQTDRLRAYPRADLLEVRWDLAAAAVWINGWTRLDLTKGEVTDFRDHIPAGDGFVANAMVSPDGQWLVALRQDRTVAPVATAHLVVVDLVRGTARTLPEPLGVRNLDGPGPDLWWSPDGARVLVDAYRPDAPAGAEIPAPFWLDPATGKRTPLDLGLTEYTHLDLSPAGRYLAVARRGIWDLEAQTWTWEEPGFWSGIWSGDRLLPQGGEWRLVEAATGKVTAIPQPADLAMKLRPLALSADGQSLYLVSH